MDPQSYLYKYVNKIISKVPRSVKPKDNKDMSNTSSFPPVILADYSITNLIYY
jgi:hypothetical protein